MLTQITKFTKNLVKIHVTGHGIDKIIDGKKGQNIAHILEENNIPIKMACEGNGACGTCMVYVKKGAELLNEASEEEYNTLDFAPKVRDESRLACRSTLINDDGMIDIELPLQTRNLI
jgi:ferredoxin